MKWKQLLRRLTWNANENTASETSRPLLVGHFPTQKACSARFIAFLLVNSWGQLVASLDFWLQTKSFVLSFFSLIFLQRNGILKSFAFWDLKKFKDYSHVDFIGTYWTDETIITDNTLFYHNMNQSLVLTFYLNYGLTNLYVSAENYPVLNSSEFFCWQINKETLFIVLG